MRIPRERSRALRRIHALGAAALCTAAGIWAAGAACAEKAGNPSPAFRLVDQDRRIVDHWSLADKPSVIHFGFTHCPVVCPTTLFELAERIRELGPQADEIRFLFVTVDPERDTPDHLKRYLASFDSRIIGLTGEPAQIKSLADGLGATYARQATAEGGHTFDHSIYAYLMARGWSSAGTLYMGTEARSDRVLARIRALVRPDPR